jgi:hypothetical protein
MLLEDDEVRWSDSGTVGDDTGAELRSALEP